MKLNVWSKSGKFVDAGVGAKVSGVLMRKGRQKGGFHAQMICDISPMLHPSHQCPPDHEI